MYYFFNSFHPKACGKTFNIETGSSTTHGLWQSLEYSSCPAILSIINIFLQKTYFSHASLCKIYDIKAIREHSQVYKVQDPCQLDLEVPGIEPTSIARFLNSLNCSTEMLRTVQRCSANCTALVRFVSH